MFWTFGASAVKFLKLIKFKHQKKVPNLQSRIIDSNEPTLHYVGKSTSCSQSANIRAVTNKNIH